MKRIKFYLAFLIGLAIGTLIVASTVGISFEGSICTFFAALSFVGGSEIGSRILK